MSGAANGRASTSSACRRAGGTGGSRRRGRPPRGRRKTGRRPGWCPCPRTPPRLARPEKWLHWHRPLHHADTARQTPRRPARRSHAAPGRPTRIRVRRQDGWSPCCWPPRPRCSRPCHRPTRRSRGVDWRRRHPHCVRARGLCRCAKRFPVRRSKSRSPRPPSPRRQGQGQLSPGPEPGQALAPLHRDHAP